MQRSFFIIPYLADVIMIEKGGPPPEAASSLRCHYIPFFTAGQGMGYSSPPTVTASISSRSTIREKAQVISPQGSSGSMLPA